MSIPQIVANYEELCSYCDTAWRAAINCSPDQFRCRKGCDLCCELQTVTAIEAFYILHHIDLPTNRTTQTDYHCPFITDNACTIYNARPVICRTHGMLLYSKDFSHKISQSCPENFTDCEFDKIDKRCILDIDRLTTNLLRLNIAFCMTLGEQSLSDDRIKLSDIRNGNVPECLRRAYE